MITEPIIYAFSAIDCLLSCITGGFDVIYPKRKRKKDWLFYPQQKIKSIKNEDSIIRIFS